MVVHVELVEGADTIPVEFSEATFARLVALSERRGQSVESLLVASIASGLPQLEREVLGEQFVDGHRRLFGSAAEARNQRIPYSGPVNDER